MNILLVTPFFPPQTGGVGTYLDDLRRHLSNRSHKVYVLRAGDTHRITPCPEHKDAWVYEFALRVLWYPNARIKGVIAFLVYLLPTLWRLAAFLRIHRIDVVSLEYPQPWMAYFYLVRFWMPIKVTVGLHGDDVLSLHLNCKHEQWLVRYMIRRADWVLAHSSSLLSQAERIVEKLSEDRSYIPYGVECERLRDQAISGECRVPVQSVGYVLTIAKLYPRKGIDILLQAISQLETKVPDLCFAIAGDGPDEQILKQMAQDLRVEHRVMFLGDIRSKDIPALVKNCEFFVLPSRSEPFGIVLLEAMTFGKAIIATKVGGIPEFVQDGFNGLLVPSEDSKALATKIDLCIEDHDLRERIGKNGLSVVENQYDYGRLILRYERLYETILGSKESCSS